MKKILLVFGTRPEAIKMAPLYLELKKRKEADVYICTTGQHKEMLRQVLDRFSIKPDFELSIMKRNQTLFDITNRILTKLPGVLTSLKPDVVLVHGDTHTAFASALCCFYLKIPVGHVEAGLRTHNLYSPFPEEFNRQCISLITKYHFAPTKLTKNNLLKENKTENIYVTGNTVVDAMKYTVIDKYNHPELEWVGNSPFILITAHRRENIGEPMVRMFRAIRRILNENKNIKAIYPIHLNPVVREIANKELKGCENIHIIEPLDVFDCHNFEARCALCLTDSGGIQEECPTFGKPVLVMRDTTERPEGIISGSSILVGSDEEKIYNTVNSILNKKLTQDNLVIKNPYGDGLASKRIADILLEGETKEFDL